MKLYPNYRLIFTIFLTCIFLTSNFGQNDPNPNSSTPNIITIDNSSNALLSNVDGKKQVLSSVTNNSKVTFYVEDLELINGEGINSLRVYAEDDNGKMFRFPILSLDKISKFKPIYAITVSVRNEVVNIGQPNKNANLLLSLAWRGLISNKVNLSLGKTGVAIGQNKAISYATSTKNLRNTLKKESDTTSNYVGYRWSGDRKRFLEQATFGPTAALDQRIRRIGLRIWLGEQFNAQYPTPNNPYPDIPLKPSLQALGCPPFLPAEQKRICDRDYYSMFQVQNWFFKEAYYGDAQLKHKATWALSQIWVTSGEKTQQPRHMIEYHKVLSRHAFGNYRDLMYEMTLHPTMGIYLDMARNSGLTPNENYARELLQLFTIGLYRMNQDGTLIIDANNRPIPTYDQETVNNFTKVLTGWTLCFNGNDPQCPNAEPGLENFIDPMFLRPETHAPQAKTLLDYPNAVSRHIPANQNAYTDLNQALDNIFYHPNVAPFVSKILIKHFVTSDPTPAYVGRVSAAFNNNGAGVRGDMKAVIRAILLDPEARGDFKTDPNYGKLREPVQYVTNIMRHLGVRSADGQQQSDGVISTFTAKMGQDPFNSPTVFNYYPPDYAIPGTTYNAPEFWILTTLTAVARLNFADKLAFGTFPPDADAQRGTAIYLSDLIELIENDPTGISLVNELDRRFLNGRMPLRMRNTILTELFELQIFSPEFKTKTALYLLITSSEFQIQR